MAGSEDHIDRAQQAEGRWMGVGFLVGTLSAVLISRSLITSAHPEIDEGELSFDSVFYGFIGAIIGALIGAYIGKRRAEKICEDAGDPGCLRDG